MEPTYAPYHIGFSALPLVFCFVGLGVGLKLNGWRALVFALSGMVFGSVLTSLPLESIVIRHEEPYRAGHILEHFWFDFLLWPVLVWMVLLGVIVLDFSVHFIRPRFVAWRARRAKS